MAAASLALIALLALPPLQQVLQGSMLGHMLVQIPLLAAAGAGLASALPPSTRRALAAWNRFGLSGTLLALVTALFWMLPRQLDAAVEAPAANALKFLTLPLLLGLPLRLSWAPLTAIGRGLVWSHLIAMLWVIGWLYLAAPVRVCNNYLLDEQTLVGRALVVLGCLVALAMAARALFAAGHRAPGSAVGGVASRTAEGRSRP